MTPPLKKINRQDAKNAKVLPPSCRLLGALGVLAVDLGVVLNDMNDS